MDTELRQLEYFVAVAEELHFGRAAKRLGLTQPPLSQQIQKLEDEIGVTLFDRTNRRVQLTHAGRALLAEARKVLADAQTAVKAARDAAAGRVGRLSVAFVGSATYGWLPEVIRAYQERHPDVELVLREMPTPAQMEALTAGEVDVGVVRLPAQHPDLHIRLVERDDCVAVVPSEHSLAARSSLFLVELAEEPFVLVSRAIWPGLYDGFITLARALGFEPRVRLEVTEVQTAVGLVAAGLGVSIVPSATERVHRRDVRYLHIDGQSPTVELGVAWRRRDTSPLVAAFLAIAESVRSGLS
ncbi:LysR family transcriptional regulator [Alicyclobacillus mali]|uniref:LysR family transcriptional regulator n=1 Tax=Alicyclobacillus mali (ex Roth et al. 2021) TaxID=1123961 RepID=A0ABS0F2Y9_9BACL|nr:LysR family transcriptional regulator [Alicyclobacillus mali (ex Roth et al. 2021)]MBF8377666.1 LysR family transcriptional regulator [Alicyclobacillus mali (ex Roth et al. 2021)]